MFNVRTGCLVCGVLAAAYLLFAGTMLWYLRGRQTVHVNWSFEVGGMRHPQHGVDRHGYVYLCADWQVIAVNPDGSERWRFPYYNYGDTVCYEPLLEGGALICEADYYRGAQPPTPTITIYPLSRDGRLVWENSFEFDGNFQGNNVSAEQAFFLDGQALKAYSISDGTCAWTIEIGGTHNNIWPQVDTAGNVYLTLASNELIAINPGGEIRWRTAIKDCASALPAVCETGTIYLATLYGELHAVDPDGQQLWQRHLGPQGGGAYIHYAEPQLAVNSSGTVCVLSELNGLFVYQADGALQYEYGRLPLNPAPPAISEDGVVYLQDDSGITAISPDGRVRWRNPVLSGSDAQPQLAPHGSVYVMHEGTLYALEP